MERGGIESQSHYTGNRYYGSCTNLQISKFASILPRGASPSVLFRRANTDLGLMEEARRGKIKKLRAFPPGGLPIQCLLAAPASTATDFSFYSRCARALNPEARSRSTAHSSHGGLRAVDSLTLGLWTGSLLPSPDLVSSGRPSETSGPVQVGLPHLRRTNRLHSRVPEFP